MVAQNRVPSLRETLIDRAELPDKVISSKFHQYLFSDVNVASCPSMIETIQLIVSSAGYSLGGFDVFTSWNREYLSHVKADMNWYAELRRLEKHVWDEEGYSGLTLLDSNKEWILYQLYPNEIGVFAINSELDFGMIKGVGDSFFNCNDMRRWLKKSSQADIGKVESVGIYVLSNLIKNYG